MPLDERLRKELKKLGSAINGAISSSDAVHEILAEIRAMGFDPYLVLDATVAFQGNPDPREAAALPSIRRGRPPGDDSGPGKAVFKINVKDLKFLKSVGIDPTRPVKTRKRKSPAYALRSTIAPKE